MLPISFIPFIPFIPFIRLKPNNASDTVNVIDPLYKRYPVVVLVMLAMNSIHFIQSAAPIALAFLILVAREDSKGRGKSITSTQCPDSSSLVHQNS